MAAHHIDAGMVYNQQFNWDNLSDAYKTFYESWNDELKEHCDEYEELTLEEKILVDENMKYLEEHSDCLKLSINKLAVERSIIELLERDKNDKRNRKQSASRRNNK